MKITTLIENQAPDSLCREHGLAVHMEYKGKNYLLDTGASGQYVENAHRLGIRLSDVDAAFLSHAHYDHSGGYREFFSENSKAVLYLQNTVRENCYSNFLLYRQYIGVPKGLLENIEAALDLCQVRQRQSPVSGQFHTTFPDFRKGAAAGTCILRQKTVSGLMISATNRVSSLNANMILCCSTAVAMRVLFLSLMKSIMP